MIARGELGHDAPIGAVQVHLAEQLVRQQPRVRLQHRGGTLVTGRLKSQHPHEMTLSQLTQVVAPADVSSPSDVQLKLKPTRFSDA